MIYTARQLEQLLKTDGKIVLPFRARLTPLARDWAKLRNIAVSYGEAEAAAAKATAVVVAPAEEVASPFLWWCDGAAGMAKAALMGAGRECSLTPMPVGQDGRQVAAAVKHLVLQVKQGHVQGGILITANAAQAMLFANRSPVLRAVLGTTHRGLEDAIRDIAPNVLVLEEQRQTMQQAKNLILRFVRATRQAGESLEKQLKELAS
jgi:hypothetical protein